MTALGVVGIIAGLALFMFLVYKGWHTYWVAPLAALLIAVTNGMGLVDSFLVHFIPSLAEQIINLFDFLFLGAILGKVFADTGAATIIADKMAKLFVGNKKGPAAVRSAVLAMIVLGAIMTYGGINAFIQLFTMLPIAMYMAEKVGIPRRFVPAILCLNAAFLAAPGVPQLYNIIAMGTAAEMGAPLTKAFGVVPGLIGCLVCAIVAFFILSSVIIKAMNKGETFDWGGVEKIDATNRKLPPVGVAILPLVAVFLLYTVLGMELAVALSAGIIVCLIAMFKFIPDTAKSAAGVKEAAKEFMKPKFPGANNKIINSLNQGAISFPGTLLSVAVPTGLAGVVTATTAFGVVVAALSGVNIPPIWIGLFAVMILAGLTSSPVVAISIVIPIAMSIAAANGIDVNAGHLARVICMGATTFETLPVNGAVLLALGLCKCTHKEGYGGIFSVTVLATIVGSVVTTLLCVAFPMLP